MALESTKSFVIMTGWLVSCQDVYQWRWGVVFICTCNMELSAAMHCVLACSVYLTSPLCYFCRVHRRRPLNSDVAAGLGGCGMSQSTWCIKHEMECSRMWWIIHCALCLRAHRQTHPSSHQSVMTVETRRVSMFAAQTLVHMVTIVWRRSTRGILAPPPSHENGSPSSFAATVQMMRILFVV